MIKIMQENAFTESISQSVSDQIAPMPAGWNENTSPQVYSVPQSLADVGAVNSVMLRQRRVYVHEGKYEGMRGTLIGFIDGVKTTGWVVKLDDGRDVAVRAEQADMY